LSARGCGPANPAAPRASPRAAERPRVEAAPIDIAVTRRRGRRQLHAVQHSVVQVLELDRHEPGRAFDVRAPEEPEALGRRQVGSNRKIPDVCNTLSVGCMNDFVPYRRLGFSTA